MDLQELENWQLQVKVILKTLVENGTRKTKPRSNTITTLWVFYWSVWVFLMSCRHLLKAAVVYFALSTSDLSFSDWKSQQYDSYRVVWGSMMFIFSTLILLYWKLGGGDVAWISLSRSRDWTSICRCFSRPRFRDGEQSLSDLPWVQVFGRRKAKASPQRKRWCEGRSYRRNASCFWVTLRLEALQCGNAESRVALGGGITCGLGIFGFVLFLFL